MVAKVNDTRFQNLTVDHHTIMNLAPARRVELLDSSEGRSILSNLTAQQLQKAFPYQSGRDDSTGEKLKSITTGSAQQPQTGDKPELSPGTKEKLGGGKGRSDPGAKAQLTKEQKEVFELLKKGEISADDPRVGFIKKLSDDDLKSVGIEKVDQEGKQSFKLSPTKASQMTDEEVVKTIPKPGSTPAIEALKREISKGEGDYQSYNRGKAGDTPKNSRNMDISQMTVGDVMRAQQGPNRQLFAVGKYQFIPQTLDAAVKYTGIDKNTKFDAAAQEKLFEYLISSAKRPRLAAYLEGRSTDINGATEDLALEFASMPGVNGRGKYDGDKAGNKAAGGMQRVRNVQNILQQAQSEKMNPVAQAGETSPTPEQIAAARQKQEQREFASRESGLAGKLNSQQQASAADVTVNKKSDTQAKVYYAGDSVGQGVGTAAGGIKLAQSGLKFTDPAILQQLAKVPKGSTVELHGGTNDAVAGIKDPDVYRQQMKNIADLAKANGITVNVNGPPKANKNWDPNAAAADSAMAAAAQEHGLNYRSLRQYTPPEKSDGVHFDNKGYQSMVRPLADPVQPSATEQQAQAQTETQPVPSMPDGGEMQTDADQLQVYALDKNKLHRDDSIALDGEGKPQFTMNSKESMKFDPNTGTVEVDNGAKGLKNDPNKLGPEQQQSKSEKTIEERSVAQPTQQQSQPLPTSTDTGHNSMYESVNLTENVFKTPSFERAVARSRFQNSGEPALGGHFDGGAYGMV